MIDADSMKAERSRASVGIIGAGSIVANVHLPVLLNLDSVLVSWIADIDEARSRRLGKAFRVRPVSLSGDLADLPSADIVLLAAPYGARTPYFEALKRRNTALYVEKPFACTEEEHDDLCDWFGASRIADGFQRRSWGPAMAMRTLIDEEVFGPLRKVRFGVGRPGIVIGNRYASDFGLAGGGILMEVGVHGIDLILFLLRATGVQVTGGEMMLEDKFDVHTHGHMLVQRRGSESVLCEVTASSLRQTTNRFDLEFETASLSFSMFAWEGFRVRSRGKGEYLVSPAGAMYPITPYQTFHRHWRDFVEGVRIGEVNRTMAVHSRLTTRAVAQLYGLAGNGK